MLCEPLPGGKVRCDLCAHRCVIFPCQAGICRVRENRDGTLYSLVYGHTAGQEVDPIEKKPLFHFYPGSTAYSITTVGCNFHCQFCQNWTISQAVDPSQFLIGEDLTPEQIVDRAINHGCKKKLPFLRGSMRRPKLPAHRRRHPLSSNPPDLCR